MNKITFLVFALAITHTLTQDCTNPLETVWTDITAAGPAAAVTGNNVCSRFNTGADSCCLVDQINQFEARATTLIGNLETAAGERDTAILAARKNLVSLQAKFVLLYAQQATATTKLQAIIDAAAGNEADAQEVKDFVDEYVVGINKFFTDYSDYRTGFETFQKTRATCLTRLVKSQVAGWCLACNQNYADLGVTEAAGVVSVAYSPELTAALLADCYPYLESAGLQGTILRYNSYFKTAANVDAMTAALTKINADDATGLADFKATIASPDNTNVLVTVPNTCDDTTCAWIGSDLFANAQLSQDNAIRVAGIAPSTRRRLQSRRLQGGAWGYIADEAKIAIVVEANPAKVENVNDLSALRVGVFSCIVAFFVALLI